MQFRLWRASAFVPSPIHLFKTGLINYRGSLPSAKYCRAPAKLTISNVMCRRYQASKAATSAVAWPSETAAWVGNDATTLAIPVSCSGAGTGPDSSTWDVHLATRWRHTATAAITHDAGMTSRRISTWPQSRNNALLQRTCSLSACQSSNTTYKSSQVKSSSLLIQHIRRTLLQNER